MLLRKTFFQLILVFTIGALAGCKGQEQAFDELAGAAIRAETEVYEAIRIGDLEQAKQISNRLEVNIRETVNEYFQGNFCTVRFQGIDCDPSSTPTNIETTYLGKLDRTAIRYERILIAITENTPVTEPALANFRRLNNREAKQDIIAALSRSESLKYWIVFNALRRGNSATCRDMRSLGNEFEETKHINASPSSLPKKFPSINYL